MRRKRPCGICRRWFLPSARAGKRQKVCSDRACQRERHRRSSRDWHLDNPGYDREDRLRSKLVKAVEVPLTAADPLPVRIDAEAARDAVGMEVAVVIEEMGRVLTDWMRDAVLAQTTRITMESPKHAPVSARDAMGAVPLSP